MVAFAAEHVQEEALEKAGAKGGGPAKGVGRKLSREVGFERPAAPVARGGRAGLQVLRVERPWLIVSRKWDETAMELRWGATHAQQLFRWAVERARRRQAAAAAAGKPLQALPKVRKGRHGALQIIVQAVRVRWGAAAADGEVCIVPPLAVERLNAETLAAAMDQALPSLSMTNLEVLGQSVSGPGLVCLVLTCDSAPANWRLVRLLAAHAGDSVVVCGIPCAIHRVHLALRALLLTAGVLSPLFSLSHLLRFSDYQSRLAAQLLNLVSEKLQFERVGESEKPSAEVVALQVAILDHTLLREARAAARTSASYPQPARQSSLEERRRALALRARTFFNGPWMTTSLGHWCRGCCRSVEEAQETAAGLLMELLLDRLPPVPALNRWSTTQPNLAWWALAGALGNFVPEAWCREWPPPLPGVSGVLHGIGEGQESPPADDWHAQQRARLMRGSGWLGQPDTRVALVVLSMLSFPIDCMIGQLSSADDPANVRTLVRPLPVDMCSNTSPPCQAMAALRHMVCAATSPLNLLLRTLATRGSPPLRVCGAVCEGKEGWSARSTIWAASLAGGIFMRFAFLVQGWPLALFHLMRQDLSQEEKEDLATTFWHAPACCVGRGGFGKLRHSVSARRALNLRGPSDLLGQPFQDFLTAASRDVGIAIADVERAHSQNRHVSKGHGSRAPQVSLERVRFESVLQGWLREHVRRGRMDPRGMTVRGLAAKGVETLGARRRGHRRNARRIGVGGSAWIMFRSARMRGWRHNRQEQAGHGGSAKRARQQQERVVREEWQAMSEDERLAWRRALAAHVARRKTAAQDANSAAPRDQEGVQPSLWGAGDERWPLAAAAVQDLGVGVKHAGQGCEGKWANR